MATEVNSKPDQQLLVHLEEYKSLTQEIDTRLKHQDSLFNWALVLLAALSGTMAGYPETLGKLLAMNMQWVFLLVPLVFMAISFDYQAQYFMMANLASYLNLDLRPRICRLIGVRRTQLLGWQDYLMERRMGTGLIEALSWNARYIILVVLPLLWVIVYISIVSSRSSGAFTTAEIALLSVNTLGIVFLIYSNIVIARGFYALTTGKRE